MLVSVGLPASANTIKKDVGVNTKTSLNVSHRVVSPAGIAERTASLKFKLTLYHIHGLGLGCQQFMAEAPPRSYQDPLQALRLERQSLLRVSVQDDEVLSSVSEPLWFRRRRSAILLRFLRLLQFPPPALGNRPYDTGRRSLWSRRTAHHRSPSDPNRKLNGLIPNASFAERRNRPFCLRRPGSTRRRKKRRSTMPHKHALQCRTSPSRGGVHTWGTPFFCFTQQDLGRC